VLGPLDSTFEAFIMEGLHYLFKMSGIRRGYESSEGPQDTIYKWSRDYLSGGYSISQSTLPQYRERDDNTSLLFTAALTRTITRGIVTPK
jgi:hypothetical protein